MADFRKGDIVKNLFAGKNNPTRFLLYMGEGTCKQGRYSHKVYNCIGYNGEKVQLFRDPPDGLVKVGHMYEYDTFMAALKSLADRKDGADNG